MIQNLRKKEDGFTLIELMIVIAIIGILSAVAIPNFIQYRKNSANAAAQAELKSFYNACTSEASTLSTDKTYDSSTLPSGFGSSAAVTISGSLAYDNELSTFTANGLTSKHAKSDVVWSCDNMGRVTGP